MKNREKLLKANYYDVLVKMDKNLISEHHGICIMDALLGDEQEVSDRCTGTNGCEQCIQTWLNEEG